MPADACRSTTEQLVMQHSAQQQPDLTLAHPPSMHETPTNAQAPICCRQGWDESAPTLSEMLSAMSRKVGRLGWRATCSRWMGVSRLYVSLRSCGHGRSVGCTCHKSGLRVGPSNASNPHMPETVDRPKCRRRRQLSCRQGCTKLRPTLRGRGQLHACQLGLGLALPLSSARQHQRTPSDGHRMHPPAWPAPPAP